MERDFFGVVWKRLGFHFVGSCLSHRAYQCECPSNSGLRERPADGVTRVFSVEHRHAPTGGKLEMHFGWLI